MLYLRDNEHTKAAYRFIKGNQMINIPKRPDETVYRQFIFVTLCVFIYFFRYIC